MRIWPIYNSAMRIETQDILQYKTLFKNTNLDLTENPTFPTDDVRPVSISCLCRKSFCRAIPRPSSSTPCVKTPRSVDLPASTLPVTATLK